VIIKGHRAKRLIGSTSVGLCGIFAYLNDKRCLIEIDSVKSSQNGFVFGFWMAILLAKLIYGDEGWLALRCAPGAFFWVFAIAHLRIQ
jgi:hypothetical protein